MEQQRQSACKMSVLDLNMYLFSVKKIALVSSLALNTEFHVDLNTFFLDSYFIFTLMERVTFIAQRLQLPLPLANLHIVFCFHVRERRN